MLKEHENGPPEKAYVRAVEKHQIPREGTFSLVICMFKAMSELLSRVKWPTIDTSFKRVHMWQEFEMEAWGSEFSCCELFSHIYLIYHCRFVLNTFLFKAIVLARGFTTSQSAEAHLILFRRVFEIMELDTGCHIRFLHLHGTGIETITADQHRGQVLGSFQSIFHQFSSLKFFCAGLGKFCKEIAQDVMGYSASNFQRPLHKFTEYEHLASVFKLCFEHYSAKIYKLRGHVPPHVTAAMMSLASVEELSDYKGTLKLIRSGGKKSYRCVTDFFISLLHINNDTP